MKELLKWNRSIALISRKEEDPSYHFIDSIKFSQYPQKNSTLIDIGTGGGFPGLVTAIIRDDLTVYLFEPVLKKVAFLQRIKNRLHLDNVVIKGERVESDSRYDFIFDNAVCKAFTDLQSWENLSSPIANTLWFLASEKQTKSRSQSWEIIDEWSNPIHGKRFLLKRESSSL